MKIAVQHPEDKIIFMDTEWRRHTLPRLGFKSASPISTPLERIQTFREQYSLNNLLYIKADINSKRLEEVIRVEKPVVIYHLAQQPSAPYSMKGTDEAIFTLQNNESGNMRLLWAVKQFAPAAHIVKLGSFGQYAKSEIDIPEGHFIPEYNGKKAGRPLPFPREADDIYHISKINDSNYVAMACRQWQLRITEIMQSTVFGILTREMSNCPGLYTRLDYDECFGTVVNRFMAQAVAGHPLTVFGTGEQRTGLMPLKDVTESLARFTYDLAAAGEHRIINHVTETHLTVNEIAAAIACVAREKNIIVTTDHVHNPRGENENVKLDYAIETRYIDNYTQRSAFNDVVGETLDVLARNKANIDLQSFTPHISWSGRPDDNRKGKRSAASPGVSPDIEDGKYWDAFRKIYFPSRRINLNPGTLGTLSVPVINSRNQSDGYSNLEASPLGIYQDAQLKLNEIGRLVKELWPSDEFEIVVTPSITQIVNLLSLNLLRRFYTSGSGPYTVVTTYHEHSGGLGCFHHLPEYEVIYLTDDIWNDRVLLAESIAQLQPEVVLFSHVLHDTGVELPVAELCATIRQAAPCCKIIVDAAQSLGLYKIPFSDADVILSSTHKWLYGPHGGGLMWIRHSFAKWLEGMFWNEASNSLVRHIGSFESHGGQDFFLYSGILEALQLYKNTGADIIWKRSCYLGDIARRKIESILEVAGVAYQFLNSPGTNPVISIGFYTYDPYPLYHYLNEHMIHIKCIKNQRVGDTTFHILRIGLPYYETLERVHFAMSEMEYFMQQERKPSATAL